MKTDIAFTATREDFLMLGLQPILARAKNQTCNFYWPEIGVAYDKTDEPGLKQILKLLYKATELSLILDSIDRPIGDIEQFEESHLDFFQSILSDINSHDLKARIADILYLRRRRLPFIEEAVKSYLESSKNLFGSITVRERMFIADRLERALQISFQTRQQPLQESTIDEIQNMIPGLNKESFRFADRLIELLREKRATDKAADWITKYEEFADNFLNDTSDTLRFPMARTCWEQIAKWQLLAKNTDAERAAKLRVANLFEDEADLVSISDFQPNLRASSFYGKAIEAYRKVGGQSIKVEELNLKLRSCQQLASQELVSFRDSIDVSEIVEATVNEVTGKDFRTALFTLAVRSKTLIPSLSRAETFVRNNKSSLDDLFATVVVSPNGRVIAKKSSDETERLNQDMFDYFSNSQRFAGQTLEHARIQILNDHFVRLSNFSDLLSTCPILSAGRENIVARGLYYGLNGDFLLSTHLLIPQIEESLRYILIQSGIVPTSYDDNGIQDELNLNSFLTKEKFKTKLCEIFGEEIIFDLRTLLIERFGSNLRNEMAHGLIDEDCFYSPFGLCLWLFCVRFYLFTEVNRISPAPENGSNLSRFFRKGKIRQILKSRLRQLSDWL